MEQPYTNQGVARVSRMISDLFGEEEITNLALEEAIQWKLYSNYFMKGE